eukprot:5075394-Prorocentrum_lima.AAC.1
MNEKLVLLMLSPPCTLFSTCRRIGNFKRDRGEFSAKLAEWQHRRGRGAYIRTPGTSIVMALG